MSTLFMIPWVLAAPVVLTHAAGPAQPRPAAAGDRQPEGLLTGGEIRITFGAEHLVLGQQKSQSILVATPRGASDLQLSVNVGRIGNVQRVDPERHSATFLPPDHFYPQVAIVAASARVEGRAVVGWATLPLWGQGDAQVRTRPGARATVVIGRETFGPVVADEQGIAAVPVVVPPGIQQGWDGRRRVELNLPAINRLHAFLVPRKVQGHKRQSAGLYILVTTSEGRPLNRPVPEVGAFGRTPTLRSFHRGVWHTELTVPAGRPASLEVQVSVPGYPESRARLALQRVAGPPAMLKITAPTIVKYEPITVQALVTDALGTPVDTKVSGWCQRGSFEAFVRRGPGRYEALWRPPSRVPPLELQATLQVRVGQELNQSIQLSLVPPEDRRSRRELHPAWFWSSVALSGALLSSGLVTRIVALDQSNEYNDPQTSIPRRLELKDSGEALTTASSVLLAVGAAAAVNAVVLYWFTSFKKPRSTATILPLGSQVHLYWRF